MMVDPDDDERLVTFLKQYRPVPPPVATNFEAQLMLQIERHSLQARHPSYQMLWVIPSAIVVGLLTWGGYRWLNPAPQIVTHPDELESFLVNNWNGSLEDTAFSPTNTPEGDWLVLADPKTDYFISRP